MEIPIKVAVEGLVEPVKRYCRPTVCVFSKHCNIMFKRFLTFTHCVFYTVCAPLRTLRRPRFRLPSLLAILHNCDPSRTNKSTRFARIYRFDYSRTFCHRRPVTSHRPIHNHTERTQSQSIQLQSIRSFGMQRESTTKNLLTTRFSPPIWR